MADLVVIKILVIDGDLLHLQDGAQPEIQQADAVRIAVSRKDRGPLKPLELDFIGRRGQTEVNTSKLCAICRERTPR